MTLTRLEALANYEDGDSIHCPHCNAVVSRVVETRHHRNSTRRKRRCTACKRAYFTREQVCTIPLTEWRANDD